MISVLTLPRSYIADALHDQGNVRSKNCATIKYIANADRQCVNDHTGSFPFAIGEN